MNFIALLRKILPYLIGAGVVVALFFGAYNMGYSKATLKCKEGYYKAQLAALQAEKDNLEKQYESAQMTISELRNQKEKIRVVTKDVIKEIIKNIPGDTVYVPGSNTEPKQCSFVLNSETIAKINSVRSGVPK